LGCLAKTNLAGDAIAGGQSQLLKQPNRHRRGCGFAMRAGDGYELKFLVVE
jgi:hypothetical protein